MEFEVVNRIGARRHERNSDRQTYRNGYRERPLHTRLGTLELPVPKLRQGKSYWLARWFVRSSSSPTPKPPKPPDGRLPIRSGPASPKRPSGWIQPKPTGWHICTSRLPTHRLKIHSTHPLERLNKAVKRRANVVGIFPNEARIRRLIGAVLMEQNEEWLLQQRYLPQHTMADTVLEPRP